MQNSGPNRRVLPQSLENEQATLGSCLMERDATACAVELLKEEDFYREHHKKIYRIILKLFDRGEPADIVTVSEELRRAGQLEECGGGEYLVSLIESCPSSANIEAYARIVYDKSIKRQIFLVSEQIKNWAYETEPIDSSNFICRMEDIISKIRQRQIPDGMTHVGNVLRQGSIKPRGTNTGFHDLDNIIGGLHSGELTVLASRPSMGKTGLALNIAHHVALKERLPVAVFSLEMSKPQVVQRIICSQTEIRSQDLRRGRVQDADWHRITNSINELYQSPIFIDDTPEINTNEIGAKSRRLISEYGQLGLIVIDYLQLVYSSGKAENRSQELSELSRSFKSMARELNCPVLILSQLSRRVEQREDKRPMLSDLSESGSVKDDADTVMLAYRASYYRRKEMMKEGEIDPNAEHDEEVVEVIIAKNHNGPIGTIKLAFQPKYVRFNNLAHD